MKRTSVICMFAKTCAIQIVGQLVEKEMRRKNDMTSYEMTDARKKKIKDYTKLYMTKVVAHLKKDHSRKSAVATVNGENTEDNNTSTPAEPSPFDNNNNHLDIDVPNSPKGGEETSPADSMTDIRERTSLSTPLEKMDFTPSSPKRKRVDELDTLKMEVLSAADSMITPSSLEEEEEEGYRPVKRARSASNSPSRRNSPDPLVAAAA